MALKERNFAELLAQKLSNGETFTYMTIATRATKSNLDIKVVMEHLIFMCDFLMISDLPQVREILDDALKKKPKDFKSVYEYQKHLAKQQGFKSHAEYLEHLAKRKGFKSWLKYRKHLTQKKGFNSFGEYQKHLAKRKGFKSQHYKKKFDAGTRFVAIVLDLEAFGLPAEMAIAEAEKVIKFPTKKGKQKALEMLDKARKKGF